MPEVEDRSRAALQSSDRATLAAWAATGAADETDLARTARDAIEGRRPAR